MKRIILLIFVIHSFLINLQAQSAETNEEV